MLPGHQYPGYVPALDAALCGVGELVTCAGGCARHGMTATAVTARCMEPASLLVCINARTSFLAPLLAGRAFCVNVLQSSQADISRLFGGEAIGEARFAKGQWHADTAGIP